MSPNEGYDNYLFVSGWKKIGVEEVEQKEAVKEEKSQNFSKKEKKAAPSPYEGKSRVEELEKLIEKYSIEIDVLKEELHSCRNEIEKMKEEIVQKSNNTENRFMEQDKKISSIEEHIGEIIKRKNNFFTNLVRK